MDFLYKTILPILLEHKLLGKDQRLKKQTKKKKNEKFSTSLFTEALILTLFHQVLMHLGSWQV